MCESSLLNLAIEAGHLEMVRLLMENNADTRIRCHLTRKAVIRTVVECALSDVFYH